MGGVDGIGGCKTNGVHLGGVLALQTLSHVHKQTVEAGKVQGALEERETLQLLPSSFSPSSLPLLYSLL